MFREEYFQGSILEYHVALLLSLQILEKMPSITNKRNSSSSQKGKSSQSGSISEPLPIQKVQSSNSESEDDDDDDEDDDEAPEEQTNASTKKAVNLNKEREIAQKRKLKASRQASNLKSKKGSKDVDVEKEIEENDDEGEEAVIDVEKEEENSREPAPSTTTNSKRLDPALFAATFTEPLNETVASSSTNSPIDTLYKAQERRRKAKRKGGIVQGRDGQPMRRMDDGRTIVRVIEKRKFNDDDVEVQKIEEVINKPETMNEVQSTSMQKAQRFKKNKLGLKGTQATVEPSSRALKPKGLDQKAAGKGKKKTDEDPLGLEDPAFMKGGEMEHLGLSSVEKTKRGSRRSNAGQKRNKNPSTIRRGDAGRRGPTGTSRYSVPLQFAR